MTDLEKFLREKLGQKRPIRIAYNGGSDPGGTREIVLTGIHDAEHGTYISSYLAHDVGKPTIKNYRVSRIIWASDPSGKRINNDHFDDTDTCERAIQSLPELPVLNHLAEYAEHLSSGLTEAGWHVKVDSSSLGICTFFKNGKPKKTPSVAISFEPISNEYVFEGYSRGETNKTMANDNVRARPWRVDSWRFKRARTFCDLHHAVSVFAIEAVESDPSTAGRI